MKRIPALIVLLLYGSTLFPQNNKNTKEINEQVWHPFIKAFANGDDELFKSVHSKEVLRVMRDDGAILDYEQYFKKIPDSIKAKWGNWKKDIELRFIQRIASDDKAFEVGFYKTTSTNSQTGEQRKNFGWFHVLLRKENGVWKILMDADTGEGASEENFNKAGLMQQ
ncbi:MAG TPA: nuclear transport factor 2 family protein [Chitinophagaceae bacterium]|nr:nuclear transport factor 2 family protein [Chitinophagaceae bacterium]